MFLGTNIEQRNITARLKTGQKRDRCVTQIPDYRQQMKTQIPFVTFYWQNKGGKAYISTERTLRTNRQ